ncbi:hypothetical protein L1049_010709 [Liquidambar formosana]|uniref:Tropomyosin n=1 Tax=Liquidambar formosana TaxID=63359 RepID=A0AAP0NAB4_LIQFO
MAVYLVLFHAIFFSSLLAPSHSTTLLPQVDAQTACENQQNNDLIGELREMKLQIARLEATFEESLQKINAKSLYLEDREKLIEEMENKIHHLQHVLFGIKGDSSQANERLNALEEEVRLLWATSRKNNFDIHVLESKAQDAEDRLGAVNSQAEKMADIVNEQWIQIRHLEQALQITELRVLKAQRHLSSTRCTFLKFINNFSGNFLQKVVGMLDPYLFGQGPILRFHASQALHQLKRILSAAKKYHHELQGFIKQEMERNEYTAAFANEEVVFFVASAVITFPIMSVWMLVSSQFC